MEGELTVIQPIRLNNFGFSAQSKYSTLSSPKSPSAHRQRQGWATSGTANYACPRLNIAARSHLIYTHPLIIQNETAILWSGVTCTYITYAICSTYRHLPLSGHFRGARKKSPLRSKSRRPSCTKRKVRHSFFQ